MTEQDAEVATSWLLSRDGKCPFDPPPDLARLRDDEPMARIRLYDDKVAWLATRYPDIKSLLPGCAGLGRRRSARLPDAERDHGGAAGVQGPRFSCAWMHRTTPGSAG
jgi:hypothetical protein